MAAFVDRGNYPVVVFEAPDGNSFEWFPPLVAVKGAERRYGWEAWAAQEETKLREDSAGKIPNKPFRDLLERYSREVSVNKRGAAREQKMIDVILRDPVAEVSLRMLAPTDIAAWRDRRLMQVSGSTVEREMTILSHACSVARREWGWVRVNPVSDVRRPPPTAARTRRPTTEETEKLLHALGYSSEAPPETASARVGAA